MTRIYGIRNCDTMKKARMWLEDHGVDSSFHDYKLEGIDRARLQQWCAVLGWEAVINRAGTTFRKLEEAQRQDLNQSRAIELMVVQPSLIKRPMLEHDGQLLAGFKPERYAALFGIAV
jgi:hypothetical protein